MNPWTYLPVAFGWTLLTKVPLGVAMARTERGYDNRHPRTQQAALTGRGARALGAHKNAMEAFPAFAAGLIAAILGGGDPRWVHILAIAWLVSRIAYTGCYLGDVHWARSLCWFAGVGSTVGLMFLPVLGA